MRNLGELRDQQERMPPHKQILEEICEGCKTEYCTLREILLHSGLSDRMVVQIKCIEKYKYEQSQLEGKDIGWEQANMRWVERGYAERFSRVYKGDVSYKLIYKGVMEDARNEERK